MNRNLHHIITTIITVFISVTLYAAHTNAERLSLLQPLIQYDLAFNTGVTTDSIILWEKLLTPELEKQQRYDILFQLKAMAVQSSITEGNISLAIDNANSMYKKAKEIDYPLGTALALRAIGNTYLSSSTPQVAIGSYEEAIEIMQQIPEADIYLKNALSQMILIKLNNRQMAGIEKDINYLEALCDKRPDSPCYFYLPCCRAFYEIQSDKLPSALEHLQKMERIYAKHPYPYFLLLIKYLYASYHIAAKEYTQALQSYDELLPYVKESGSYKDIQISQERAKVLSLMGRIEEACEEYEVINARKDSLDANSYLRQINELHTLYQIDKNELNNINRQKKILYWSWFIILSVLSLIIFFIFRIKRNNKRLIQSQQEQEKVKKHQIFGIEFDENVYGLATTNMLIHSDGNSNIRQGSCFALADWIKEAKPNVILMNPPYNGQRIHLPKNYVDTWAKDKKEDPSKGLYFVKYIADTLNSNNHQAKLAVLLPVACAIGTSGEIARLKREILEENALDAVFTLPSDIFHPGASASACCMVFKIGIKHCDVSNPDTFFGYCRDDGFKKKKKED